MAAISVGELEATLRLKDQMTPMLKTASASVTQFGKDIEKVGTSIKSAGQTMTTAITLPLAAIGAAAVVAGTSFIKTMNTVAAVTNAGERDLKRLTDAANEWGNKTQFSSAEAASAMLELGKAGFDANQTIGALPSVLNLATASSMSLADAANLTSNVMKTFGLGVNDLAHVNDILASAANSSTIEVTDLREAFKYVGPVAAQSGVSLAEAAAAMALLGEAGIKGSMAGTTLRNVMTTLMSPTKKQAELMRELGLQGVYANGKLEDMSSIIDRITSSGQDSAKVLELFGDRAGPGMAALVQKGSMALATLTAELDNTHGSAQRMSDAAMKGFPGALERMRGAIETASTALLTALEPSLIRATNAIAAIAEFVTNRAIPAFMALDPALQGAVVGFLGIAAAAGPALIALGSLVQLAGIGAKGVGLLSAAVAWLGRTTAATAIGVWALDAAGGALLLTLQGVLAIAGLVGAAFVGWKLGRLDRALGPHRIREPEAAAMARPDRPGGH
jgi:TP901 family phage tail tape measure protein